MDTEGELGLVAAEIYRLDPSGARFARVIRDTLDQLYDGQRTGRWSFDQLHKTKKTHMGTLVEINLHREFAFGDGTVTDYRIDGIEVDCKYSMNATWSLPPEVIGHLALLVTASDEKSTWRAGLLRVELPLLNTGRNRDGKGTLSALGRKSIQWLWELTMPLAPNLFLTLPSSVREQIFHPVQRGRANSGQARVNALFRLVQRRIIRRSELATVAQQDDFMKRARGNGGARTVLQPEGILILGNSREDPYVAQRLGLPVPILGELVSARVTQADQNFLGPTARIGTSLWRLADQNDPVVTAPDLR